MKAQFGNKIPWAVVRENSSRKKEVLSLVSLPGDVKYELFPTQPKEGDANFGLVYLYGNKPGFKSMLLAIHRTYLNQLVEEES